MFGQPDLRFVRSGYVKNCFFQNMTEILVIYLVACVGLMLVKIVNFANSKAKRKQNIGV